MEIFSFIVSVFVIMISAQYKLYWLMVIVAGVAAFMSKEKKVFIILAGYGILLYLLMGTSFEAYGIYAAAAIIVVYLVLNKDDTSAEDAVGGMGDQYGDLLKGLGG
jgi:hypothetical protein